MCTIADAKVQRNYNCYNVYFNECLQTYKYLVVFNIIDKNIHIRGMGWFISITT